MRLPPEEYFGQPLSPREQEIATLVTDGLMNKEITYKMGISDATTRTYVTRVMRKLGVRNRTQIAVWVTKNDQNQTSQPQI